MENTDGGKQQGQIYHNVQQSNDDVLLRYPYLHRIPEEGNGIYYNSLEADSESITLRGSRNPLTFANQICHDSQQSQGNQQLSINSDYSHHIAVTQGIQNKNISNPQTSILDYPLSLHRDPNVRSRTAFFFPNSTNKASQSSPLKVLKSSPVNVYHRLVSPTQKTPAPFSEECTIPKPSSYSKKMSTFCALVTGSNSTHHQNSTIKEMDVDVLSEASCREQHVLPYRRAENKYHAVSTSLNNTYHSRQTIESSIEEEPPVVDVDTLDNVSSTRNYGSDEQSNSPELRSGDQLVASLNSNGQGNSSVDSVLNKADIWADRLVGIFQKMNVDFSESCQIAQDLHISLVTCQRLIECIAKTSENIREKKTIKRTTTKSKEMMAKVQQVAEKTYAEKNEEQTSNVNFEEDKNKNNDGDLIKDNVEDVNDRDIDNKFSKTNRGNIRTFILPPEYDADDTRWTLKYRKRDPKLNLVELVPHTNVFVNSIRLAHCKRVAKDCKALARMLLVEIFTQSALSVCSLTGARANAFDVSGTNVRPGLDENARMALLSFVEEYTRQKKWGAFDIQIVINSLRSKIQEIRAKHGKTA